MGGRLKITVQISAVLGVLLAALVAVLYVLEVIPKAELAENVEKCVGVWVVLTLAALIITFITAPRNGGGGQKPKGH